jgi:hypothetical protein
LAAQVYSVEFTWSIDQFFHLALFAGGGEMRKEGKSCFKGGLEELTLSKLLQDEATKYESAFRQLRWVYS